MQGTPRAKKPTSRQLRVAKWEDKWQFYVGRKVDVMYRLPGQAAVIVRGTVVCMAEGVTGWKVSSFIVRRDQTTEFLQIPVRYVLACDFVNRVTPEQIDTLWAEVMEEVARERASAQTQHAEPEMETTDEREAAGTGDSRTA